MKKDGVLILAQVDHLTGEELGFAIDQIMRWGANNVYVFPGITKKGRSGCVLLIDINPDNEPEWARLLAEELSIYGYHRVLTSHYCSQCHERICTVVVRKGRARLRAQIHVKTSKGGKGYCRVEHSDLVRLREQVKEKLKIGVSLSQLRASIESYGRPEAKDIIEIDVGA
ncbi:MAG: DUF111 family protein [Candidatus Abyssobacteria bacterium SURF_17]|jgi:uncharacterized protein (DUF111 family)|uniref:DUF111 family protein n=1 Tax=Candidatus Abyssobacteria bacterium SURF_17 TaxID=2093361 RepID=A0A419EYX5_9BACT|nr:MAG: DUF111 family protein [Candidatus Abyssubacteria bacterium SURF_17]